MSEEADPHAVRMSKLRFSIAVGLRFVEEETGKSMLAAAVFRDIETRAVELEASIARLVAEVERHRMTEEERKAVACAAEQEAMLAVVNDDDVAQYHTKRALVLRSLLDRTATEEVGRE